MQRFSDKHGCVWDVVLDIPTAKTIWQRTGINLRSRPDLGRLTGDESLWLVPDVLYVLCEAQALRRFEAAGGDVAKTSAEFGRMLEGCLGKACESLFAELADFCRRLGLQATARLTEALSRQLATQEAAEDQRLGAKMVPAMEAEMAKELARREVILDKILGTSAGNSPESSACNHSPESRCDNCSCSTPASSNNAGPKLPGSVP